MKTPDGRFLRVIGMFDWSRSLTIDQYSVVSNLSLLVYQFKITSLLLRA